MSAFEVVVTPTRIRNGRKITAAREPIIALMAPFSGKSIVAFEDVPVTKTARRYVHVQNPTDKPLQVKVANALNTDYNITFEWMENEIPANSYVSMEIVWNPLQSFACKEKLQLIDNRNFKKEILIVMKSSDKSAKGLPVNVATSAAVTAVKTIRTTKTVTSFTKKLKMKSPSPPKRMSLKKTTTTTTTTKSVTKQADSVKFLIEIHQPKNRTISNPLSTVNTPTKTTTEQTNQFDTYIASAKGKENKSPKTPSNASAIFNDINFTPLTIVHGTDENDIDYLAAQPTPKSNAINVTTIRKPLIYDLEQTENDLPLSVTNVQKSNDTLLYTTTNITALDEMKTPAVPQLQQTILFEPQSCSSVVRPRNLTQIISHADDLDDNNLCRNLLYDHIPSNANKTFEIKKTDSLSVVSVSSPPPKKYKSPQRSPKFVPALNRMVNVSPQQLAGSLSTIAEECNVSPDNYGGPHKLSPSTKIEKTFNIVSAKPSTPLSKKFQSMKDLSNNLSIQQQALKYNQGSMPNLRDGDDVDAVKNGIETNRYYLQQKNDCNLNTSNCSVISTVSQNDVMFKENEIRAQSSRFNLNEIDPMSFFVDIMDCSSSSSKPQQPPIINNGKCEEFVVPKVPVCSSSGAVRRRMNQSQKSDTSTTSSTSSLSNSNNTSSGSVVGQKRTHDSKPFSQQKRLRTDSNDDTNLTQSEIMRMTWNSTQVKKFRMPRKSMQLCLKRQSAERITLFDPELHIQGAINPDAFAASTTSDPFMAATIYHDEKSIDKHATQILKWLNACVTIPSEFTVTPKKMDFGRLFNDVRNKEISLAETKEVVSSNYLTKYRLDNLRNSAIKLYMSDTIRLPLEKLVVHIEKRLIAIRSDRNLHLDIILQQNILELLLCFNPIWLRIGLEVIYGEQIYMEHNADIFSLSVFILNRMFKDQYLGEKYNRTRTAEYADHMRKYSLRKFLMLLFFLDTAKQQRIIVHNPCLFLKSAAHKETKEILLRFSSELLANVGDIQRDLKRIGIVMTHKQCFIDEFDYAFRNLAIDLRDGIRLTKVMETILLRDDLTQKLRVPAISRLQKVHNVGLGLQALKEAGYNLSGNITPGDIADGHREKTLSLLWQIIYTFRAPKFNAAAVVIQNWWRKSWLRVVIRQRIAEKLRKRKIAAAIVLQSGYRGYIARKYAKIYRKERTEACVVLQSHWRRVVATRRYQHTLLSTIRIQQWFRTARLTQSIRQRFVSLRTTTVKIQKWRRRICLARKIESIAPLIGKVIDLVRSERQSAIVIQQRFRANILMKQQRESFLLLKQVTISIQQRFRATLLMKSVRTEYLKHKQAATCIQRWFRNSTVMREKRRQAAVCIQTKFRAYLQGKEIRDNYLQLKASAICFQRFYRARLAMKIQQTNYKRIQCATIYIQRKYRATQQMKIEKQRYDNMKRAAIKIQYKLRATIEMRIQRQSYTSLLKASRIIQIRYRAQKLMIHQRFEYVSQQKAAITIQRYFRATVSMSVQRKKYETLRNAAILIQTKLRATIQMRIQHKMYTSMRTACHTIQTRYRAQKLMIMQRTEYMEQRKAAICLQTRYRALLAMRKERKNYQRLRATTLYIQQIVRANNAARQQKQTFNHLKSATITIQKYYRNYLLMKQKRVAYTKLRSATIIIQQQFRAIFVMRKVRADYQQLYRCTVFVQAKFRATLLANEQRHQFLMLKKSAQVFQSQYRAKRQMNIDRSAYDRLRHAAIVIQRRYRAKQSMKSQRREYLALKHATIMCQRRIRANSAMMEQRSDYLCLKESAIFIQKLYRGKLKMQIERHQFVTLQKCCVNIQRRWRANKLAKTQSSEYLRFKSAATCIQRRFRAKCAMNVQRNRYLAIQQSCCIIQRQYRARLAMIKCRRQFLTLKSACITIQRRFHGMLLTKKATREYALLKTSSITIQQRWRATLLMRRQYDEYQRIRSAVLTIQYYYKATVAMQIQRDCYNTLRSNVIAIQRRFRANKFAAKQKAEYSAILKSTLIIQHRYRAQILMKNQRLQYLNLKAATITIQRRFIANQCMKMEVKKFQTMKKAAECIQQSFRAYLLGREQRNTYRKLQSAAICIQRHYRARVSMCIQRANYLKLCSSTIIIQRWFIAIKLRRQHVQQYQKLRAAAIHIQRRFRDYQQMKLIQQNFQKQRNAAIIIQQRYRAFVQMKRYRLQYLTLRKYTIIIQSRFRANLLMKKLSNQYKLIRCLCVYIQRRYRANIAMRIQREQYLKEKSAAIRIQQQYRAQISMKCCQQQYESIKRAVYGIQQHGRGVIARRNFQAKLTPEFLEMRRRNKAAKIIQSMWRGYIVRRRPNRQLKIIRDNIKVATKKYAPQNTISQKICTSIVLLKSRHHFPDALGVLTQLVKISRTTPQCLVKDSEFISNFCYGIMSQAIRSEVDKILIEQCSYIILNLSRYNHTRQTSFQSHGLTTIAQMLLRWCDKDCPIFDTLCTVIWVFSQTKSMRDQIREFMTAREAQFILSEIKHLVVRKENMRKNRSYNSQQQKTDREKRQRPILFPDFGLRKLNKGYIFYCSVFAFDTILSKLNIKI